MELLVLRQWGDVDVAVDGGTVVVVASVGGGRVVVVAAVVGGTVVVAAVAVVADVVFDDSVKHSLFSSNDFSHR